MPEHDAAHANTTVPELKAARKRVLLSLKRHTAAIDRFLPVFLEALAPVDQAASRQLLKRLSTTVHEGSAPSFAGCAVFVGVYAVSGYMRQGKRRGEEMLLISTPAQTWGRGRVTSDVECCTARHK